MKARVLTPSVPASASLRAAAMLVNGILQTYEHGDEAYVSRFMDPDSRYAEIVSVGNIRIKSNNNDISKDNNDEYVRNDNYENKKDRKNNCIGYIKVYKPVLFQKIRKIIGMSENNYLECLDFRNFGMTCLTDSDSKSGQSFWIAKNEQIVLKTIKKYECKNLYCILNEYYDHINGCAGRSCISTVLGLYRVILKNGEKRYFMVSRNVYPVDSNNAKNSANNNENTDNSKDNNDKNIDKNDINNVKNMNINKINNSILKFDLKGSTVGRLTSPTSTVLKDLNLISSNFIFPLNKSKNLFLQTLEKDVLFLKKYFFMDYSLLVAVEDDPGSVGSDFKMRFIDDISVSPSDR